MASQKKGRAGKEKILITAALPYANGPLHLGHMVEYVQADIFARVMRLTGEDTAFVCADDTHGAPIEINAAKQGIAPEELIRRYYEEHTRDFSDFLISFDTYYTTNSSENRKYSDFFFNTLKEKGFIYQKMVELTYCEACRRYLPDRYVKGRCPKCDAPDQYGDVCEKCNSTYRTIELKEPYCSTCGNPPSRRTTLHYFFKLSAFSEKLERWLVSNPGLQAEAKNFVMGWISKGLEDWDITRDGPYFGFLIPGETSKYYYVWLDAPIGYIASTEKHCKDAESYWKSEDSMIVHFIGKDIVYFHFLFWPAMLMGVGYNLPDIIKVHGFLTVNGEKMSKSRGTFITARDYLGKENPEFLRFYYASSLGDSMSDVDLDFGDFQAKVNSELVDNIANFAYRVLSFANNNLDSKVGRFSGQDELVEDIEGKIKSVVESYRTFNFRGAVRGILEISTVGNQYFQENKPWHLIRTDRKKCESVVALSANIVKNISILLSPVMPRFCDSLQKQLGLMGAGFNGLDFSLKNHKIAKARIIFTRIEGSPFSVKAFPLSLKVAQILSVDDHPGADRLYVLRISLGEEERQLVAGLKAHYLKDELVGKNIVVVANLKEAVIRGVKSKGMLLAADDGSRLRAIEAPGARPGDPVIVEGFVPGEQEISIEEFMKVRLTTRGRKVVFNGQVLRTEKGDLVANVADSAKVR
ncbi:methionine--tRNA ligase [Candidatus Woesearchaeota archaeon]|nr:methionine--tRNA ligase [Candidatus Woesearchaeota archaeon]